MNVNVGSAPYSITPSTFTAVMAQAISDVNAAGGGVITVPAPSGNIYYATDWLKIKSGVSIVFSDVTTTVDFGALSNSRWAMVVNDSLGAVLDHDISIYGGNFDMKWDGGGSGGSKYVQAPASEMTYRMGVQFCGVRNLTLDHVTVSHTRNWSFAGNRLHGCTVNEVTLNSYTSSGSYSNEGTFQFQGENSHIRITNLRGTANDDMLAFVNGWTMGFSMTANGPMTDIVVDGVFLNTNSTGPSAGLGSRLYDRDPLNGIRIESPSELIDNVVIRNVVGYVREQLIELGSGSDYVPYGYKGPGNLGYIEFDGFNVSTAVSGVGYPPTTKYPSVSYVCGHIDTLVLRNFNIANTDRNSPPIWVMSPGQGGSYSDGHIKNLVLDNFSTAYSWGVPLIYNPGTIENLFVKNWGGKSSSYFVENLGMLGAVNLYGVTGWSGKISGGPTPTNYAANDPMVYTTAPAQMPASYPRNVRYNGSTGLTWTAVPGATSYTVYHQYIVGYDPPSYTTTEQSLGSTAGTSFTLPGYGAGQWHLFSVQANNQAAPSRAIYAQIGTSSGNGDNWGYVETVTASLSGSVYTISGARTDDTLDIIAPTIAGASVSAVSYNPDGTWSFTISGLDVGVYYVPVFGVGPAGVTGPLQAIISVTTGTTSTSTTLTTAAPGPGALNADPLNGWGALTSANLTSSGTTTTVGPAPGVPQVTPHAGNREITLSWPAVPRATSYNVYHTSDGSDPTLSSTKDSVSGSPAVFTGLINGAVYKFAVSSVGTSESALSSVVSSSPFIIAPLRFNVQGTVLSFAETPGGPLRICIAGKVLEFAVGGSGPVRLKTDAGIVAISSPSDVMVPQDMYSGGSLDLADLACVLVAANLTGTGRLSSADAGVADTLPSADMTGGSTLGAAEAVGIMAASDLSGSSTVTTGTTQNALGADSLTGSSTLDQATGNGGLAGVVADDLAGNSTVGAAELAGQVLADDLATTCALDVPVTGGVVTGDALDSTGTLSLAELVALGMIDADALTGSGTLDLANLTMPDALPANDLAGGAGTLSTASLALVLGADALTGSGTLNSPAWSPTSSIAFTNITPDAPVSTIAFTGFS